MGLKFNPLIFSGFDNTGSGGGGGSSPTIGGPVVGGTDKSVLFVNPDGTLNQDNTNFNYDINTQTLTVNGSISSISVIASSNVSVPSLDRATSGTLSIGTTNSTTINIGNSSNTINVGTYKIASSLNSISSSGSTAGGNNSIAVGNTASASGNQATAFGFGTTASANQSMAVGSVTTAAGFASLAAGFTTTAQGYAQLAIGRFNVLQGTSGSYVVGDQAFIIGNGTSTSARTNAFTITNTGNVVAVGTSAAASLLLNGSSSGTLTQTVPSTVTSYSVTWPSAQASGTQVLQNNGSGTLSWATVSSGITTVGSIDTNANANGLFISGSTISTQSASATNPGMVNNTTQSFSGNKTFTGSISASNLSGTNSGDVTLAAFGSSPNSNGASLSTQVLTLQPADATNPGGISTTTQTIAGAKTFSSDFNISSNSTTALSINSGALNFDSTNALLGIGGTAASNTGIYVSKSVTSANQLIRIDGYGTTNSVGFQTRRARGTSGSPTAAQSGDSLGFYNAVGYGTTAFPGSGSANMTFLAAENFTDSALGTHITFTNTSVGTTSRTERMRIAASGNILIATTTDNGTDKLQVNGSISATNLSGTNTGNVTLTAVGSSPSANGASLSGQALTLQPADGSNPGLITSGTQTIGGAKTFSSTIAASNLSGTNTGDQTITLTGDITGSGTGSFATTLATVNSNTGSFGSSTAIPSFTVNGKGLITAASTNVVVAPAGTLSGTTLNATVVSSSLTSVGTIATGTWSATTIALNKGGTGQTTKAAAFDALQPMTTGGDLIYGGASGTGTRLANGSAGQVLTSNGTTLAPTWNTFTNGFQYFNSSQVTTNSSNISSGTFTTFSNSPAFSVACTVTGKYKIYTSAPIFITAAGTEAITKIVNTSGGASLVAESQCATNDSAGSMVATSLIQSVYTLTSGNTYVFDIQGKILSGTAVQLFGTDSPFYMFAELCG